MLTHVILMRVTGQDDEPRGAERVLRAAIEVIAERGFRGASTSEIARRAGVAEGTIFRHFKTKQLLLTHIVEPFVERVLAPLALRDIQPLFAADFADFGEFLRALARNRLELGKTNLPILRILVQEAPLNPELRSRMLHHVGARLIPEMLAMIRRFQARGELRDDPPETILRVILSTFGGYFLARFLVLPDRPWDDDAELDRKVGVIVRGFAPDPPARA